MFSNDNSYTYGNALGRIQGHGRFNNVNSIIVNSKRIFIPEHLQDKKQEENEPKYSYLQQAERNIIPLKGVTSNNKKYEYKNLKVNYNLPNSFDTLKNKYYVPPYHKGYISSGMKKNDFIEKIFYDYKKNTTSPLQYQQNSYRNVNAYSDIIKNPNNSNKGSLNNYRSYQSLSHISLPDEKNDKNSFDFHSQNYIYPDKPSMFLTPNILHNTTNYLKKINDIKYQNEKEEVLAKKAMEVKKPSPSQYSVVNSSSVSEYSYKQVKNDKYQLEIFENSNAEDKYDTSFYQGLFCLFSGINGNEVSKYCSETFPEIFQRQIRYNPKTVLPFKASTDKSDRKRRGIRTSTETLFLNSFLKLDDDIKYMNCYDVGATSCVVFITREKENITGFDEVKKVLYCANCGEIQCMLVNSTNVKKLSTIHNLSSPNERKRVDNSGGVIYNNKIYGQLYLTRCFGMKKMKQYGVTVIPDVTKTYLNDRDRYVVIGNKGIFDVLSEGDILLICSQSRTTEDIVNNLIQNALNRNTRENLSCFVIKL